MKLEIDGDTDHHSLSPEVIENAIRSLSDRDDGFVILSTSPLWYVQVLGNTRSGFALEYQEKDSEHHYDCPNPDLTEDQVIEVFQRYLAGDAHWKDVVPWQATWQTPRSNRLDGPAPATRTRQAIVLITIILLALITWLVFDLL